MTAFERVAEAAGKYRSLAICRDLLFSRPDMVRPIQVAATGLWPQVSLVTVTSHLNCIAVSQKQPIRPDLKSFLIP